MSACSHEEEAHMCSLCPLTQLRDMCDIDLEVVVVVPVNQNIGNDWRLIPCSMHSALRLKQAKSLIPDRGLMINGVQTGLLRDWKRERGGGWGLQGFQRPVVVCRILPADTHDTDQS